MDGFTGRRSALTLLVVWPLLEACGPSAATPGPEIGPPAEERAERPVEPASPEEPASVDPAAAVGPMVEVLVDDPFADEGAFHSFTIHPDGSFEGEHVWSDGGAEDQRSPCSGQLPEAAVQQWFDYARERATLEQPRPGPPDLDVALIVTVSHTDASGVVRHAPVERQQELLEWSRALLGAC